VTLTCSVSNGADTLCAETGGAALLQVRFIEVTVNAGTIIMNNYKYYSSHRNCYHDPIPSLLLLDPNDIQGADPSGRLFHNPPKKPWCPFQYPNSACLD
jgi:hypothetical protein